MKLYQVILSDEFDNMYHLGFYKKLDDSIKDINIHIKDIYPVKLRKGDIKLYLSSFGFCFDKASMIMMVIIVLVFAGLYFTKRN